MREDDLEDIDDKEDIDDDDALDDVTGAVIVVAGVDDVSIFGLRNGDTPRELNGLDWVEDDVIGEPNRLLRDVILEIVDEMVARAACLARSVETKLLTKSLRFPLSSGEANNSIDVIGGVDDGL